MPKFCPHCGAELPGHDARRGGRCPSCRLVVGVDRARDEADDEIRTGGFMANAARREGADPVAKDTALAALSAVAETLDTPVDRLRMTDYDKAHRDGAAGPSVAEVLATFDTWKAARTAAAVPPRPAVLEGEGSASEAG